MKVVVRMAIAVVTLLVLSNMAFAQPCTGDQDNICYEVTMTDEWGNSWADTWLACLDEDGVGTLCHCDLTLCSTLYQFGGGPGWFNTAGNPMFGGNPLWTSWISDSGMGSAWYLQPQGTGGLLLTAEGHLYSYRYTVKGKKVPMSNCLTPS